MDGSRISKIETDENPNPEIQTLAVIAGALEVELFALFHTRPEESPGHAYDSGGPSGTGDPNWEQLLTRARAIVGGDFPEADSLEGDVLQAHAVLDRAVRRLGRAYANRRAAGDDER